MTLKERVLEGWTCWLLRRLSYHKGAEGTNRFYIKSALIGAANGTDFEPAFKEIFHRNKARMNKELLQDVIDRLTPAHAKKEEFHEKLKLLIEQYPMDTTEVNGTRYMNTTPENGSTEDIS